MALPSNYSISSKRVQQWLNILEPNAQLTEDGYWGAKSKNALTIFQQKNGLVPDGIFGAKSFTAMRQKIQTKLAAENKLSFKKYPADFYAGGFDCFYLRSDVGFFYQKLYNDVKAEGGFITSAGSKRALAANVGAGRSSTSLHYPAIAFDLHTGTGMNNPEKDIYVIEKIGNNWQVWCRSEKGQIRTISNPITYGKRYGTNKPVTGKFIDFTALAKKHFFTPIPPNPPFYNGGSMMQAEWWHFQCEFVLLPEYSTFGDELLTVYDRSTLINYGFSSRLNYVFSGQSFKAPRK